jgi:PIN domain nuclease of toxin-antitoxin system
MKYLIDTHVLLWWLFADERLSTRADAVLRDPRNKIVVSSATAWEIAIKHRAGRLDSAAPLVADYAGWVARARFEELPITSTHAVRAGSWGVAHRDPFDRMLAAQAETERVRLVTRDPAFEAFPVDTIW